MIGVFRPRLSELPDDERRLVRMISCTNCVGMRDSSGALSALALPHEANLLAVIAMGVLPPSQTRQIKYRRCTAFPLTRRSTLELPKYVQSGLSAFAVIAAWATAADHERDHGRWRSAWLRKRLDPKVSNALKVLEIEPGQLPDPRLLSHVDPARHGDLEIFLADYRPFITGLWRSGLRSTGVSEVRSADWIHELAEALGDSLLLGDALADIVADGADGSPNPASTPHGARSVRKALDLAVRKGQLLLSSLNSPWAGIARETAGPGLAAQLIRRGAILQFPSQPSLPVLDT